MRPQNPDYSLPHAIGLNEPEDYSKLHLPKEHNQGNHRERFGAHKKGGNDVHSGLISERTSTALSDPVGAKAKRPAKRKVLRLSGKMMEIAIDRLTGQCILPEQE